MSRSSKNTGSSASKNTICEYVDTVELQEQIIEAKYEVEELMCKEEQLAIQEKRIAARKKLDLLKLKYDSKSSRAGSERTHSSFGHSEGATAESPGEQTRSHSRTQRWASEVGRHIEEGTLNDQPRREFMEGCADHTPMTVDRSNAPPGTKRRTLFTSTPNDMNVQSTEPAAVNLNPACPPFTPAGVTFDDRPQVTYESIGDGQMLSRMMQALDTTVASQYELSRRSLLPTAKIEHFSGDMTKFSSFRNSFKWNVENNTEDPQRRLTHLHASLEGTPKDLIEGCLHLEPSLGYQTAWNILADEYDNKEDLSEAFIKKLFNWMNIPNGDADGLRKYAAYLFNVQTALGDNYIRMELTETMRRLVEKLPYQLRMKWAAKGMIHRHSFPAFIAFVKEQAEVAKVFSRFEVEKPSPKFTADKSRKDRSAPLPVSAAHPKETVKKCYICSSVDHTTVTCSQFQRMSVNDRWDAAASARLCFRCLNGIHPSRICPSDRTCEKCGTQSHNTMLHRMPRAAIRGTPPSSHDTTSRAGGEAASVLEGAAASEDSVIPPAVVHTITDPRPDGRTMLKILPVQVTGRISTYAFIDGGAVPTLISRKLVDRLGLKGRKCSQLMRTECGDFHCDEVLSLAIGNIDGDKEIHISEAFVTQKISVTTDHLMPLQWMDEWPHLAGVELHRLDDDAADVEIIVGLNSSLNRHILEQRHGNEDEPSAYLTKLGWVAFGPTGSKGSNPVMGVHHIGQSENITELLQENFNRDFWEKEDMAKTENSYEDEEFLAKVKEGIKRDEGKYTVHLPLRDDNMILPNNRDMALRRAMTLKKKLDQDEAYRESYTTQLEKYIHKEYAESVPAELLQRADGKVNYMPHFGVLHPTKNKLRVVFDLKARHLGHSLNDDLLQGPDLTNNLIGVVTRFRQGEHAMTSDIQEMFHQVRVPPEDRDMLRFLWWPNGDTSLELQEYRMCSHVFGAKSSPSVVNFCLRRTAEEFGDKYDLEASRAIDRNFYVDNLLKSVDDESKGIDLAKQLIEICADGGFRLNQWTSSSKAILAAIPEEERDVCIKSIDLSKDDLPLERALGVHWSMQEDCFTFVLKPKEKPRTRRGVLSVVASLYDPLGFLAPFTLKGKLLLQELCRQNMSWDEEMSSAELNTWTSWLEQLPRLAEFKLRRSFAPKGFGVISSAQLHHFSDASDTGYGVVTYLRLVNENGDVHCSLVFGRARVAPLKRPTTPKLELTAAAVAAQIDCRLRQELDYDLLDSVMWTDSTAVLKYIRNHQARYHTFVANRVNLIRSLTKESAWRYVDTASNPADLASRGMDIESFLESSLWTSGPRFLLESEDDWPQLPNDVRYGDLNEDPEVKTPKALFDITQTEAEGIDTIAKHFSSWDRLVGFVAISMTLAQRARASNLSYSRAEMLERAEHRILHLVQVQAFHKELSRLSKQSDVLKSSTIVKLRPVLQDGLLRVGGRIQQSSLTDCSKHPIILPSQSIAVKLLVRSVHESLGHCGQNHLLATLRERYWIVRGNSTVRTVIRECVVCKKLACRPMNQLMAELPSERLIPDQPPFTFTGTDCFGPFLVRRGRSEVKRYGAVFTCLTSRAVHIEMLESMETDSFMNAFRRFVSRRGPVRKIWSDNGTNLTGTEKELKKCLKDLDQEKITRSMAKQGVEWIFNPPHASNFGGIWERIIRSIRRTLKALCKEQVSTDECLRTLFCEVESIINGRPLTRATDDPESLEPLSPSKILTMKEPLAPVTETAKTDLYVKRRWRQAQYLADVFWSRWVKEYLPCLQERQKWNEIRRNLKVGDIVLSMDEKLPRGTWPLAKVLEVYADSKGLVRSAKVRTESGIYLRPINKMCLILEAELDQPK